MASPQSIKMIAAICITRFTGCTTASSIKTATELSSKPDTIKGESVLHVFTLLYPAIQADQYIYTPNKKRANQQCAGNAHAAACNKPGIQFYKQAYQFGDCHHFEHSADFLIVLQT